MNTEKNEIAPPPAVSPKTSHPMNIFLSYAHAHSAVVEDIVKGLRERGHRVWFDETNIGHGDDWRERITQGLQESNGVLSFLSREAIREGGVCLDELGIAVGEKYGNIHTVLLEKEKELQPIPAHLTHRQWLDMSDWRQKKAEGEEAYQVWLGEKLAIILEMIESDESFEFEGDIHFIREKLGIVDTAISRQGWYLRQPFVGRKWLTEKLENWMNDPNGGHLCAVYGGPGTGKSAFAAQYSYRSPRAAASLFFEHGNIHFNSPDAIVRELVFQLACRLPQYRSLLIYRLQTLSPDKPLNTHELFEELLAVPLQRSVNGGHETLCVVIDGLDECAEDGRQTAARLLSEEKFPAWLRVVVLTRPENTVTAHLKPDIEIRMEENAEAGYADIREYFSVRLGKQLADAVDRDSLLDRLSANADGVFLYAYIVADMILRSKLDLTNPDEYPKNLNDSFEKWFSRYFPDADEFDRLYKLPLGILAACAEPVPVEELDMLNARYDPYECAFVLTEPGKNARRQSVVKRLERCAVLLKYDQNEFGKRTVAFTHRYIGEWMTETDEKTGQSASRIYFCDPTDACWVLEKTWRQKLEQEEELTDYEALHLLEMMRGAGETEGVIQSTAENKEWGKLLDKRYGQLNREEKWKLCLLYAEAEVERCRCAYGVEYPDTLTATGNLASAYLGLGNYVKGSEIDFDCYQKAKLLYGGDDKLTLRITNNYAYSLYLLGEYKKSLELQEKAHISIVTQFGERSEEALVAKNNLASTYAHAERFDDAIKMLESLIPVVYERYGFSNQLTLTLMGNLASMYRMVNRYEEAVQIHKQILEISLHEYGNEDKITLAAKYNLALTKSKMDEYEDAVLLMEEVYRGRKRKMGDDHPETVQAMEELVSLYQTTKQDSKALSLQKLIYIAKRRIYGEEHPKSLKSLVDFRLLIKPIIIQADKYEFETEYSLALPLRIQIYQNTSDVLGDKHHDTIHAKRKLATCLSKNNRNDEAYELFRQLYVDSKMVVGERNEETLICGINLASTGYVTGRHQEGLDLLEEIVEVCTNVLEEGNSTTRDAIRNLSRMYANLGRTQEAIDEAERLLKIERRVHGENHWSTIQAMFDLAEMYSISGDHNIALEMYKKTCDFLVVTFGEKSHRTLECMKQISKEYFELKRYDDSIDLKEKIYLLQKELHGEEHEDTLSALQALSMEFYNIKQYEKCIPLDEKAIGITEKLYGAHSVEMADELANQAANFKALKQYEKEMHLREQVYELRIQLLGEDHCDTLSALTTLSIAYYNLEQYDMCIPLDEKAIEITARIHGADTREMATALNNLSMTYSKLNRYGEALPLMERAYEIRLKLLGADDPLTVKARERMEEFRKKAEAQKT